MRKWLTYFDNPTNGAGTADQQERFYRLDYGPVAVIVQKNDAYGLTSSLIYR